MTRTLPFIPTLLTVVMAGVMTAGTAQAQFSSFGNSGNVSGISSNTGVGGTNRMSALGGSSNGMSGGGGVNSQLGTGAVLNLSSMSGAGMGNLLRSNSNGIGLNNSNMGTGLGIGMGMNMGMGGMGMGLGGMGLGMGGMGMGMGRGMGGRNSFGQNQMGGQNGRNSAKANLRTTLRLADGFVTPRASSVAQAQVASKFQTRLTKLPNIRSAGDVSVAMDGDTAILTGAVATAADRDLVARLAMLEPGVSAVQNELVVDPSAAKPEVLPRSTK